MYSSTRPWIRDLNNSVFCERGSKSTVVEPMNQLTSSNLPSPDASLLKTASLIYVPTLVVFLLDWTGQIDLFESAVVDIFIETFFLLFTMILALLAVLHQSALLDTKTSATQLMRDAIIEAAGECPEARSAARDVLKRGDRFTKWEYPFERSRIACIAKKHYERKFMSATE
jgi:hypothetical protein